MEPTRIPTSGKNLAYAMGTLAVIVIIQRVFKGFMATVAVLAGLVIGTAVAFFLGDASFASVGTSEWFGVTTPFFFGIPKFSAAAIISMIVVMLITAVETTGDVFATGEIVEKRVGAEDVSKALRADGLSTFIGGVLNSFPYTCFAENVGLVRLTRVKSRYVVAAAGVFMILIGLIPKAGALVASVPPPVLGGAAIAMFATVAVVGIQTLARVDFHDHRNVVIVGTSLGLAVFVTVQPDVAKAVPEWAQIIFGSGITLGSLCAILLNLIFHHVGKNFGPAVAGTPGSGVIRLDQVNKMSRENFVETFGRLFQGPSWVVERAYDQRPFTDTHDLRMAFQESLFSADRTEQRDLLSFYPDLGSDAVEGETRSEESERDQGSVGLTMLNDEDHEEFAHLTEAYRDRFGIPLIVSVRDVEKRDEILKTGWERMQNAPDPGIRGRDHRGGQDRQPPVRRPGRRRQPDPGRTGGPDGSSTADRCRTVAARCQQRSTQRRPAAVQRSSRRPRPGQHCSPASTCRDGSTTSLSGRPYDSAPAVLHQARAAAASFTDEEIDAALARHPRIGEQAGAGHDAEFSAKEQSAVGDADPTVTEAIRAGNAEYESRFDRVFLIRAAGRPATEILDRAASPAEQHPRRRASRGCHPAAGDRAHPVGKGAGLMNNGPSGSVVLDGAYVVTMDAARSEYPGGHVVITGNKITAVAPGPAPRDIAGRRVPGCHRLSGHPRPGEHPPSPLPVDHPRPGRRRHPVRLADHAVPGVGSDRCRPGAHRRHRRARLAGRHRLHHHHRPPLRLPARRRRRAARGDRAAARVGLRFHPTRGSMDLGQSKGGLPPDNVVEDIDAILTATEAAIDNYHDTSFDSMLRIGVAPCSPFSVTGDLLKQAAELSRLKGVRMHTHLCETLDEEEFCQQKFGCSPVEYMESLGWLGPGRLAGPRGTPVRRGDREAGRHRHVGRALPDLQRPAGGGHRQGP